MSRKKDSNVSELRKPKWVEHPSARSNRREEKIFMNSTYIMLMYVAISMLAGIGEKEIFHELEVHHV